MPINFGGTTTTATKPTDSHAFLESIGLIKKPEVDTTPSGSISYFKPDFTPKKGLGENLVQSAGNVAGGIANLGIGAVNTIMHPIDTLTAGVKGAADTVKSTVQGAEKLSGAAGNLAQKAVYPALNATVLPAVNATQEFLGYKKSPAPQPKDIAGIFTEGTPANQSVGADLLQGASGLLGASQGVFPVASTAFNAGANTEIGKQVLEPVMGLSQSVTDLAKEVPIVSDFYRGLPEERKQDFDAILNNAIQFGATKGLSKTKPIANLENKVGELPGKAMEVAKEVPGMVKNAIPTKEGVKNVSNAAAEAILSSQWKLDKKTRDVMQQNIGENGAKFALERDIVGKDIENTADNAGLYKIGKIQEKMDAVKQFGSTETPDVARNVANVLKNDIIDSVEKSYGKDTDAMKVLEENHPELASVLKLTDEVINSRNIDYVKLEQLKELHDYLNPENIQYDIGGKPLSETKNILSAGKRGKLQQLLEEAGQKNGVDIKGINKDIQGAFQLEKGLNNSVSRIQNLNILGLGDTQVAMISSILGGAPGAVGAILLKKGMQSEGFRAGVAKKLFTKTPKDVNASNMSPSGAMSPPVTRMGRIMNNSNNTATPVMPESTIPGAKKTTVEVPSNPKGNQSTVLPKKQGVMVEPKGETKLLEAPKKKSKKSKNK